MTAAPPSVLVVIASPDDRPSTASLQTAVEELRRRGARTEVWFLRAWLPEVPWPGSRVVDSLRTWAGTDLLAKVGLERVAGGLRGLELRRWLRSAAPDVVLLDDGIGERVVEQLGEPRSAGQKRRPPVRVVRLNERPPVDDFGEPTTTEADLLIVPTGWRTPLAPPTDRPTDNTAPTLEMDLLKDLGAGHRMRDAGRRASVLESMSVPTDAPIVLGWGDDGWIDGPDLFIRGMWTLEARFGHRPTAVWLDGSRDEYGRERLRAEAERCGLGDRYFLCTQPPPEAKLCGDVTFLPVRARLDADDVARAITAGSRVVTFEAAGTEGLPASTVPDLDLETAAAELAAALEKGRSQDVLSSDVSAWVDRFLALVAERRRV